MGLWLEYGSLRQYLNDTYGKKQRADRVFDQILQRISAMTSTTIELSDEGAAGLSLKAPGKFGSYEVLHHLRAFAARDSGYTLRELYDAESEEAATPDVNSEDGEPAQTTHSNYDDEELAIRSAHPLNPVKLTPFPYPHFVVFSDSNGVYLPLEFPQPFDIDDLSIGSLPRLHAELSVVGKRIAACLAAEMEINNLDQESYYLYMRELWGSFFGACDEAMKHGVSLIFN